MTHDSFREGLDSSHLKFIPESAEMPLYKQWRPQSFFFNFDVIINGLVNSFRFI